MSNKGSSSPAQVSGGQTAAGKPQSDKINISLDWLPELKDDRIIFQVGLKRGGRHSSFDVSIDLKGLHKSELEQLKTILERRQNELTVGSEIVSNIVWLLEIALSQQGLGKNEREPLIDALLLRDRVSLKERYFQERGEKFVLQSGTKDFIESTKNSPVYNEVYRSWQKALPKLDVGTPRLKTEDEQEQEELEIFFCGLRHDNSIVATYNEHTTLVDKWISNQDFLDAISDTTRKRLIPDQTACSLEYHIIRCWLHEAFWLISHEDRALILRKCYGLTNVTGETVRKAVKKLGLKGWNDFLPKGNSVAPYKVEFSIDRETQQLVYRFVLNRSGQNG